MKIRIVTEHGELAAEIDNSKSSKNPKTAKAIIAALPITAEANRWGDEVYFDIPVKIGKENTQSDMEIGDIAYWPPGPGFCIFFGPTPVSKNSKPRIASPGNVFGRITTPTDFINILKQVKDGEDIRVERG